ncbi:MAG TPA: hypothetical protein VLF14_07195 [Candidatus Binatia bacterium]|nr:hypothetical protein [Candidatus Binatia bacterium]
MVKRIDEDAYSRALVDEVCAFPLVSALMGRRARRFALGMEIPDGPLAYRSPHLPLPLNDLERVILVLCGAGVSGWNTGIEHTAAGEPDTGCNYPVRLIGRTYASGAAVHASELVISDEAGTFITRFRDLDAESFLEFHGAGSLSRMIETVRLHCQTLRDGRVEVPPVPPHVSAHNLWNANRPGTTLFAPVIDVSQMMFDLYAVYLGMGFTPFDPHHDRVCGNLEPYFASGALDPRKRFSIVDFEQYGLATSAMEMALACHNVVLTMQAIGLGGWMYTGINPLSLMGAFAADGVPGLGFRFERRAGWTLPNPVGLDGAFEALCPPYVADMREGARCFAALKFGEGATFDPQRPGPYRDNATVKARVERYTPEFVEMLGEVAQYLYDSFGKFPATVPTCYMRAYAQAQHLEQEFYDRFFGPGTYLDSHREHMAKWHPAVDPQAGATQKP